MQLTVDINGTESDNYLVKKNVIDITDINLAL